MQPSEMLDITFILPTTQTCWCYETLVNKTSLAVDKKTHYFQMAV